MINCSTKTFLKIAGQVRGYKVAVLGASGGIGQPLALLLKLDPKVTELSLFDVVRTPGVAADISHCNTPAKVTGNSIFQNKKKLYYFAHFLKFRLCWSGGNQRFAYWC